MQRLYKILHRFVTVLFTILMNYRYYLKLTERKVRGMFLKENVERVILNEVATLTNLPRHMTFVVMDENVNFSILARLVVWSFTAGISYISIYATEDDLDKRRTELYEEVYQIRQEMTSCDSKLHFEGENIGEQNGVNGSAHKATRKGHLRIIAHHEGKEDITKVARKFCTSAKNQDSQLNAMSVEYMQALLQDERNFPDPDLALIFGQLNSICDYPPWQIRLTEFLSLPSLEVLDHNVFLEKLRQYNRCEQRLGR